MYSPYMAPSVPARPAILFQGVAGQKNSHQMFFSDKYVTFNSDGDMRIFEKVRLYIYLFIYLSIYLCVFFVYYL